MSPSLTTAQVYPRAIDSNLLFALFLAYAKAALGFAEKDIAFATSICSDDINSVQLPRTNMIGPFFMGGLDGYPFVGKTGLSAFLHHIPDKGMALLFFGPHVGVGAGKVGTILRPGQKERSGCCGAAQAALAEVVSGTNPHYDPSLDYQQKTVYEILLPHAHALKTCPSDGERFVMATRLIFNASRLQIDTLLNAVDLHKYQLVVAGGTLINEDDARSSRISLNCLYTFNFKQGHLRDNAEIHGTVDLMGDFEAFSREEIERVQSALHLEATP